MGPGVGSGVGLVVGSGVGRGVGRGESRGVGPSLGDWERMNAGVAILISDGTFVGTEVGWPSI